ncbi:serine/threonine-protein kinase PLK4 isoform X3 [Ixodes scapularis]
MSLQLSILEDGQVSVEFRARNHKVTRVLRVSSDGTRVVFYKPPLGWHLSTEGVAPAPPQGAPVHSWDALPQALWAKYACAARFVSLVRQKTPKIILYAEYALCILLGSGDLEASFYSGARVVCSGNHVQLMDVAGRSAT